MHYATPTTHIINVRAEANNPISEAEDMDETKEFTIKVYENMAGKTLVTSAVATYYKSSDTNYAINLSANTGTIKVLGAFIYVKSTGDDSKDGLTTTNAVKTVTKALELLQSHNNYAIILLNSITITDAQSWSKGTLS